MGFFSKFLGIFSYLLKKSLMENFNFCEVKAESFKGFQQPDFLV